MTRHRLDMSRELLSPIHKIINIIFWLYLDRLLLDHPFGHLVNRGAGSGLDIPFPLRRPHDVVNQKIVPRIFR